MKRLFSVVLAFILCMSVSLNAFAEEGEGVLPSGVSYSNIEAVIDAYVEEHKDTTAAVSVAVFTDSSVLMEKAYGYSDIENKITNGKDTVFEWGSCSKLLVWTSAMQLVEKGKIDLNEDIRKYLPEDFLKKLRFGTPITMLNLMNHNAGWQETVSDLFIKDKKDVKELGDALKLIEPEQIHEPGKIVAYSNWGTALAGYIVERVSGQRFDDYVHEHIFKPLGMEHTALNADLSDNEWVEEKRKEVKCYTTESESLGSSIYYLSLYPAGMATGTIGDFIKFGQAFLSEEGEKSPLFEKRQTLDEMLSPSLLFADGTTARNFHGFWTDELGVPVLWHDGGTYGSSSWFTIDPKSGTGMIILTNQYHESIYNCGLLPKVFGKYEEAPDTVPTEDISGIYQASRTVFKGFAKPYSLFTLMPFKPKGEGKYSAGANNTVTSLGKGFYLMDMGGLKQFVMYKTIDEEGNRVLQLPGSDYVEVNGYGVITKCALLALLILAALYGIFALINSFIGFLGHKKSLGIIGKFRTIVNASVIITVIMFVYISLKLLSNAPLLKEILWSVILNGVLALVPVAYAVTLAVNWKKLKGKGKDKRKLIMTCLAGIIMTINVIFWESYKFW
jgi:CubicO group peptidase (beta-lactamase class C family)